MSVIAKMTVSALRLFGDGNCLINLSCVYDDSLSKSENEDVRFTKASPFGTAELTVEAGPDLPGNGEAVYLLFHEQGDVPSFDGALFATRVVCESILDSGYTKQVTVRAGWFQQGDDNPIPESLRISKTRPHFELKMGIDNPAASVQFVPTKQYWCVVYSARTYTMAEVLQLARRSRA